MLTHPPRTLPHRILLATVALVWLVQADSLLADDTRGVPARAATAAAVPSDPVFTALLVDGSVASGRMIEINPTRGVTLAGLGDEERVLPIDRLVKLTREGAAAPSSFGRGIILLPRGDRLAHCVVGAASETGLLVQSFSIGKVTIPFDALVGVILEPPTDIDAATALEAKVRNEPHDAERLWLANGDKIDGLFAGMTDKQVLFQPPTGQVALPKEGVVALGFDPTLAVDQIPDGPYYEWLLVDGSRFGLSSTRVDRGQVVGKTRFGAEVRFPVGEVARVRILGASVDYLGDREAAKAVYEPYLGPTRPYHRNASVLGSSLRLGGQVFDRGLGTQSRTLLAYRLDPEAKRFQATIGLDDAAGPLGNVVFKVLIDGKTRFESPAMGAGDVPKPVDIDLSGGKVLILITEFGERGDVQDSGDWAEARIIR